MKPYTYTYSSHSPEATADFAVRVGASLVNGDVLALHGDLAGGKTTFTRGLSRVFSIQEDVTSPTFTLINEYHGTHDVYHFDCYRLKKAEEIIYLGFEDYLSRPGILIIEWPEIIEDYLPEGTIHIFFNYGNGETDRSISISSNRELAL